MPLRGRIASYDWGFLCVEGNCIWMITPLENVGEYRKSKSDVSQMAKTVYEDVQSTKVRCNPI